MRKDINAMARLTLLCLLSVILIVLSTPSVLANDIDFPTFVSAKLKEHRVAGIAIARVEGGRIEHVFALGNASTKTNELVQTDSVFQVGSISKPVAAWAAMTLVRDGKLNLDEPVFKYLNRWAIPNSNFEPSKVTLRRILSHTAGLTLHGYPGFAESEALPTIEQSLSGDTNGSGSVTLFQAPGEGFSYSGGGYTLLQLLIEEVSGMSFAQYVQEAVFAPLGMTSSSYQPDAQLLARRVVPHSPNLEVMPQYHFRAQAAAALHTTAADMARFIQANVASNPVLSDEMRALMQTEVVDAGFAKVGLGFFLFGDGQLVGHSGANQGWRADMVFNPVSGAGVIMMTNSENAGNFLTDVRCHWDSSYGADVLKSWCEYIHSKRDRDRLIYTALAFAVLALGTLLLLWRLVLLISKRAIIKFPSSAAKRLGMFLAIGLLFFSMATLLTPIGAYWVSGFFGSVATIHYASIGVARLIYASFALLFVVSICLFTQRKEA